MKSFLLFLFVVTNVCTVLSQSTSLTNISFRSEPNKFGVYEGSDFNTIAPLWRYKTQGTVRSSPTYANGKLFVGSSEGIVYCFDANTGEVAWTFVAKNAVHSSIAISGNQLYFTDKKNNLYALNAQSGKQIWEVDLKPDLPYEWGFDYYTSSPVVRDQTIYVGSGSGYMNAIAKKDGKILWQFNASSLVRSSPTLDNGIVFFGDLSGKVYAIDAKDGKQKWMFATRGDTTNNEDYGNDYKAIIGSVAVKDNVAVIGSRDGNLYGIDADTGKEKWFFSYDGSWVITSVAIKDNTVVTGTSDERKIQAFDLKTGATKWTCKTNASVWASPIIVGSTVTAPVNDGFIYLIDFKTGALKSRIRFGDRAALSSPVFNNGIIYVGNDDGYVSALQTSDVPASGLPVKKAVFFTSDVMGKYLKPGLNNIVRDYFVAEGYELLNEDKLSAFLKENATTNVRSVIVMAAGYFPQEVVKGNYRDNVLYNYLRQGGKVVVLGTNPALHDFDYTKSEYKGVNYNQGDSVLGIPYRHNDFRTNGGNYSSAPTKTGKKWGLTQSVVGHSGLDVAGITPLTLDENGKAQCWVKNYGHAEGTGFVQLWVTATTLNLLDDIRRVAEFGIR